MTTIHRSRACSKEDVDIHARTRSKRRWDNNDTKDSEKEFAGVLQINDTGKRLKSNIPTCKPRRRNGGIFAVGGGPCNTSTSCGIFDDGGGTCNTTNERVGQANEVLLNRAWKDFKLSLAIVCHYKSDLLPEQYRFPFTQYDNITPKMIIEGYRLSSYDTCRFEQYLASNPMQHTHHDEVYDDTANDETDNSTIEEVYVEGDEIELDSIPDNYINDSTHTSNDDAALKQEYIQRSLKVSIFQTQSSLLFLSYSNILCLYQRISILS